MKPVVLVAMAAIIAATPCIAATMPAIGSPPPLFSLPNLQNKTANLSEFSGKPLILVFFASWSKSCEKEVLLLNKVYKSYKKAGLEMLGISFDRKVDLLQKFIEENEIEFEVLIDKKLKSLDKYAILILPTVFVVGRDGNIAHIHIDFDENAEKSIAEFVEKQISPPHAE